MKLPKFLAAALTAAALCTSAHSARAIPRADLTANDTANFEAFVIQNPSYILFEKDIPKTCRITKTIDHPTSTLRSETSGCQVLYTAIKPNGTHEFIAYSGDLIITIVAPPGGIVQHDGTHWKASNVMMASMTRVHKPVMWATRGTCLSRDGKFLTCSTDDGKVAIGISFTSRTHLILKQ